MLWHPRLRPLQLFLPQMTVSYWPTTTSIREVDVRVRATKVGSWIRCDSRRQTWPPLLSQRSAAVVASTILSRGRYLIRDIALRNFDHYVAVAYILKKCECHANKISSSQTSWTVRDEFMSSARSIYISVLSIKFKSKIIIFRIFFEKEQYLSDNNKVMIIIK